MTIPIPPRPLPALNSRERVQLQHAFSQCTLALKSVKHWQRQLPSQVREDRTLHVLLDLAERYRTFIEDIHSGIWNAYDMENRNRTPTPGPAYHEDHDDGASTG